VFSDGLRAILRAGGIIPATGRKNRGQEDFISFDEEEKEGGEKAGEHVLEDLEEIDPNVFKKGCHVERRFPQRNILY
jgi:hypothetical protein